MFSHVTVGTSDVDRAKRFYDAVFAPVGLVQRAFDEERVSYRGPEPGSAFFTVLMPNNKAAAQAGNGAMVAILAPDRAAVRGAYGAAMADGGTCEGPPGLRPHYHDHYYGAYFRDPDGNKINIVCHKEEPIA